jgi:hypothetical protein
MSRNYERLGKQGALTMFIIETNSKPLLAGFLSSGSPETGLFGFLGGMFAFACLRLWLARPSS